MHVQRLVARIPEPGWHHAADLPERAGALDVGIGARGPERAVRVLGWLLELLARVGFLLALLVLLLEPARRTAFEREDVQR